MKQLLALLTVLTGVAVLQLEAQDQATPKPEFAIVKWDGPDRIQYILPGSFEVVHLKQTGVVIPKGATEEEFCLNHAANVLGKQGWEVVTLDSRRLVLRRSPAK